MGLSAADAIVGGGACQNSVTHAATRRCVNFSTGSEIGACGCVGRYFPARFPSKGRSEGEAPVGVLLGRNGGRRKISLVKFASGKVLRRWFGFCEAS